MEDFESKNDYLEKSGWKTSFWDLPLYSTVPREIVEEREIGREGSGPTFSFQAFWAPAGS